MQVVNPNYLGSTLAKIAGRLTTVLCGDKQQGSNERKRFVSAASAK